MVKLWQNFIRDYDGATYSILVGSEKYDYIHHKIRYLIGVKSGATDMVSHIYSKIKADSFHSLIKKKAMTSENGTILIISVWDEEKKYVLL